MKKQYGYFSIKEYGEKSAEITALVLSNSLNLHGISCAVWPCEDHECNIVGWGVLEN